MTRIASADPAVARTVVVSLTAGGVTRLADKQQCRTGAGANPGGIEVRSTAPPRRTPLVDPARATPSEESPAAR